jgi:hypothetical protein
MNILTYSLTHSNINVKHVKFLYIHFINFNECKMKLLNNGLMRCTEPGCFRSCSWCLWKALDERVAWAWFHDVWTCGAKVLEYWMISSLKIKLNCSWKFQRNWNMPLVLLERSWWAGFDGNNFGKIWIQNVGDIDLKVISAAKKFKKIPRNQVVEGKISWEHGNTWANGTGHTS